MNVTSDTRCFVCGPDNPVGLRAHFTVDEEKNEASCILSIPPEFQGWRGVVHGGVIASLLDEACIYACRTIRTEVVTAELSLRYRKPVPVGKTVTVTARTTRQNRRTLCATAQLEIAGTLHAAADAKVFILG